MKPLVLARQPSSNFMRDGLADMALYLMLFRFIGGTQPSQDELAHHLGPRASSHDGIGAKHWSDWGSYWKSSENRDYRDLSLAGFCQHYETVELWFDAVPADQLALIWLLDYFNFHPETVSKLKLRLLDQEMMMIGPDGIGDWRPPLVEVTEKELRTASAAWQAYRSPTPEACVDLLQRNLSALPLLKPVLIDLLAELPSASSGLGASEMRMLEMIERGYARCVDLFHRREVRQTRVFSEWELGYLLEGLAFGPTPAVLGLDEELRTMHRENLRDRDRAYKRSRGLSLTDFGKAVLTHREDFSRHNPIDRWWGGTHLTNDNLWRWSPALVKP
jgi:hypothetical protein